MRLLDWKNIRRLYEVEGLGPEELAEKYYCSSVTIYSRAKAEQWTKPTLEQTSQDVDEVVETSGTTPIIVVEHEITEEDIESITIEDSIRKQKYILARLMNELDATTAKMGEMKRWIAEDTRDDRNTNRRRALYNAVSMGSRAVMLKNAAAALKTLCEIEGMSGIKPKGKKAQAAAAADAIDDDRFSQWDTPKAA